MAVMILGCSRLAAGTVAEKDISSLLEQWRASGRVPALAAAVVKDGRIIAVGASGLRSLGAATPVTTADKFHFGSISKTMTSTLAAMLVEDGKIRWDSTVADVFPDYSINAKARSITLNDLLEHRSGLIGPELSENSLWGDVRKRAGTATDVRRWFVQQVLSQNPPHARGTFAYSNAGYVVVGHMLERVSGRSWEDLMRERIFRPLKMDSAGFGPPATPGQLDQPWGHDVQGKPVPPGPGADNPPALGPASTVHASIRDLARFAALHVRAHLQDDVFVTSKSIQYLHTPTNSVFPTPWGDELHARGWTAKQSTWAPPGWVYAHDGTNETFAATIRVIPHLNFAVVAATNIKNFDVLRATIDRLTTQYATAPSLPDVPVTAQGGRLINVSTRGWVGSGERSMIAGFIIGGTGAKDVLVRGVGPQLKQFGIKEAVVDPLLTVFDAGGKEVASNDDWAGTPERTAYDAAAAAMNLFPLDPAGHDSALYLRLAPGTYSAVLNSKGAAGGVGLIEVYEREPGPDARFINLSTRVFAKGEGETMAIPGIIVAGTESRAVLIRAVGPTLGQYAVSDTLYDPVLTLVDIAGNVLEVDDDWQENDNCQELLRRTLQVGAFPLPSGSRDAAIVRTLPPGAYTALVRDRLGGSGVVLLEAYVVPAD